MPYTQAQRLEAQLLSSYGYTALKGVPLSEFTVGEGIIVITKKGEPIMTGQIEDIQESPNNEGVMEVKVGDDWYDESTYIFRTA